jgi:hypothetical protein
MSNYTMLTGEDEFCVFVDWSDPSAGVFFRYGWLDETPTPFQTADFDIAHPGEVLRRVEQYAENMAR